MILCYRAGRYGRLDTLNSKIHPLFQEQEEEQEQYTWHVASDLVHLSVSLAAYLTQRPPPLPQGLGDLCVVQLGSGLDHLVSLYLAPHHECIQRTLYMGPFGSSSLKNR